MDEDQWMHDNTMHEEVDMNEQNENEASVDEEHVDCSYAFNTLYILSYNPLWPEYDNRWTTSNMCGK